MSETQVLSQTLRITSKDNSADQPKKCAKCDKNFKSRDKIVQCGTCKQTFHAKCQNVSDRKYDTLKEEGEDTMWMCISCNQVTRGMVQNITNIEQRVTALEAEVSAKADKSEIQQTNTRLNNFMQGAKTMIVAKADKKEMEALNQRVISIEQQVNNGTLDKDSEELSKLLEEKLKEQKELVSQQENNAESAMSEAMKEMEDRKRRSNNIVLHNIDESSSTDAEARRSHDEQLVRKIFREHLKIEVNLKLDNNQKAMVRRLGMKTEGKSRSMKVVLPQPEDVAKVLKNAKALSQSSDKDIKKIVIKPDLTPMQRKEELKLVKEKNEKNKEALAKNEPANWIIQRWKVVRRPSNQVPKATTSTSTSSLNEEYTDATNEVKDQNAAKKE